ncbi:hypothetical protein [Cupriavidus consociatus]|nr:MULTISPECIES: hypothetical protein [unclassified Cupriavidus]MBP0618956.1 hypothetical protein [Cupriavidus sp. LEh25]MDK2655601.1 hypothetical protein [Cupriavidus sp. LEh21]
MSIIVDILILAGALLIVAVVQVTAARLVCLPACWRTASSPPAKAWPRCG